MNIGNPTEWLAGVSKLCRQITEQAVVAARDAQYEEPVPKGTLEAAKAVLLRDFDVLKGMLPDDFPSSRLSDLSRHIGYCHIHDCLDIAGFDIPDIMAKSEAYALAKAPKELSGEIGEYLHSVYRARLDREMAMTDPDYHGLVLKAAILLGDNFKDKTGAKDDEDAEIGKALNTNNPTITVLPNIESKTDKNFQRGTMLLFQGVRAFYRNTFAHGQIKTTQKQAVHALIIMSMLTEILDSSYKTK